MKYKQELLETSSCMLNMPRHSVGLLPWVSCRNVIASVRFDMIIGFKINNLLAIWKKDEVGQKQKQGDKLGEYNSVI